jgi:hypothetical protein
MNSGNAAKETHCRLEGQSQRIHRIARAGCSITKRTAPSPGQLLIDNGLLPAPGETANGKLDNEPEVGKIDER